MPLVDPKPKQLLFASSSRVTVADHISQACMLRQRELLRVIGAAETPEGATGLRKVRVQRNLAMIQRLVLDTRLASSQAREFREVFRAAGTNDRH
jgi:hypothetical protein